MNRPPLEPDPRVQTWTHHPPRSSRDLNGRHRLDPAHPRIHGPDPFGLRHIPHRSRARPRPRPIGRPDPADFPCYVGGDTEEPSNTTAPSITSQIRRLAIRLEVQQSDLARLRARYVSAGNDWERTRLQMVRLHQDANDGSGGGGERHLAEHRAVLLDNPIDVRRRFDEARVHVSLAQQAVDDTQREMQGLLPREMRGRSGDLEDSSSSGDSSSSQGQQRPRALTSAAREVYEDRRHADRWTREIERLVRDAPTPPRVSGRAGGGGSSSSHRLQVLYRAAGAENESELARAHRLRNRWLEILAAAEGGLANAQAAREQHAVEEGRQNVGRVMPAEGIISEADSSSEIGE